MAFRRDFPWCAYRIADRRHKIFDGQGAATFGGRWNSPGRRIIYAGESFAGATLEMLVKANIGRVPKQLAWIEITIGGGVSVEVLDERKLRRWAAPDQAASRRFGDTWYDEKRSAVLLVPSMVARPERNVVINQDHAEFRKLRATKPKPALWDERLFK